MLSLEKQREENVFGCKFSIRAIKIANVNFHWNVPVLIWNVKFPSKYEFVEFEFYEYQLSCWFYSLRNEFSANQNFLPRWVKNVTLEDDEAWVSGKTICLKSVSSFFLERKFRIFFASSEWNYLCSPVNARWILNSPLKLNIRMDYNRMQYSIKNQ